MSKRKVAYYYDTEVGAYTYGPGHPMKPHRIRVTHNLVSAYGMLDKLHVLVLGSVFDQDELHLRK
ncbi:hypothetical protein BJ165DRAFT_1426804, partial [Panaeolus papilionaceus]